MAEMTPAERIRAEMKEASRQALLQAGLDETIDAGGVFPTIERLCARAGYTRGAFYGYFRDRDEFVTAMLDWVLNDIIQSLFDSTTEGDADVHEIVRRFNSSMLSGDLPDIQRNVRIGYLAVLRELQPGSPIQQQHADLMTSIADRLEERVHQGQEAGTVSGHVNARDAAMLLLLVAIGTVSWTGLGIVDEEENLGEVLLRLFEPQ